MAVVTPTTIVTVPQEKPRAPSLPCREEGSFLTSPREKGESSDKKQELGPRQVEKANCVSEWLELTLICDMEA